MIGLKFGVDSNDGRPGAAAGQLLVTPYEPRTPSTTGFGEQPFDDHDVEPFTVEPTVFLVDADFPEPARAAQGATPCVEREDRETNFQ